MHTQHAKPTRTIFTNRSAMRLNEADIIQSSIFDGSSLATSSPEAKTSPDASTSHITTVPFRKTKTGSFP